MLKCGYCGEDTSWTRAFCPFCGKPTQNPYDDAAAERMKFADRLEEQLAKPAFRTQTHQSTLPQPVLGGVPKKSRTGITALVAIGLVIFVCALCRFPSTRTTTSTPAITPASVAANTSNAMVSTPTPIPTATAIPAKLSKCDGIESELTSVESRRAQLKRFLDLLEGTNLEGSITQGSYLHALKEMGELNLQEIALERKLKTCGKQR